MPEAIATYIDNVKYLEPNWTENEVKRFIWLVKKKLELLENLPTIGRKTKRHKSVYKTLVHKRVMLFYPFSIASQQVELPSFWHTSRNPESNKLLP